MSATRHPRELLRDPGHLLAFGLGSGLSPIAPGTAGTLAAIPLFLVVGQLPLPLYLSITAVVAIVGAWLCGRAAHALGVHDHGAIVIDEVAGYLVTMIAAPMEPWWVIAGFCLFRFFDIVKPWPASFVDRRVTGGTGIMLDDLIAGLYGLLLMRAGALYLGGGV